MVEKRLNNTTPYGEIRASHEGSLHSSTLRPDPVWIEHAALIPARSAGYEFPVSRN